MKTKLSVQRYAVMCSLLLPAAFGFSQEETPTMTPEGLILNYTHSRYVDVRQGEALPPDVWEAIGPNGITAISLAVAPANSNIIFAGGLLGIYKTTNGGANWELASAQTLNLRPAAIAIHPANPNLVLAWLSTFPNNLMRSTDGGRLWTLVLARVGSPGEIIFNPLNPQIVFTSSDSLYRSIDGGVTWKVSAPFRGVASPCPVAVQPRHFVCHQRKNAL